MSLARPPEEVIDLGLAWGLEDFSEPWLALCSRRGAALLSALERCRDEQCPAGAVFHGTFVFYRPPNEADYYAYPVHSATGQDGTGAIKTLELFGKNSAEEFMHKKQKVRYLVPAAQRTPELDAAALEQAERLQLTPQQLQHARMRLIALRELAKICKLEREISQLSSDSR